MTPPTSGDGTAEAVRPATIDSKAGRTGQPDPGHGPDPTDRPAGPKGGAPAFPEARIRVTAWPDPVLDKLGHDPRSVYVERFWLPILGPSCLLLVRRLAADLERRPDGFEIETAQLAPELGIGMKGGRHGPLWRAVERACRFGGARRTGDRLAVRRRLPPLTARQIERLPEVLRIGHEAWSQEQLNRPRRPAVARWTPHTAPPPPSGDGDRRFDDAA